MILAGASLSLTGRFALQGRQAFRGLRLWEGWANREAGLSVGLRVYDDGSRIAGAQANVRRLLAVDGVDLLFGPYSSSLTLAVGSIAEAHGKILWNHGGASDEIFARGWRRHVGGIAPASAYFADLPGWFRRQEPGIDHLTILHAERGTFGRQVARGLDEAARREGFDRILVVPCDLARVNPSGALSWSADGGGHALVLAGSYQDEVRLLLNRESFPSPVRQIAAVAAGLVSFGEALGAASGGILGASQWEPGLGAEPGVGPGEVWIRSGYRQAFGGEPEYPAVQAFSLGVVATECVRLAGSLRDEALREAAASLEVATCLGRFRIDPETGRQLGHRPVLVEWRNGRKLVAGSPTKKEASCLSPTFDD